jgi:hypothetical protein
MISSIQTFESFPSVSSPLKDEQKECFSPIQMQRECLISLESIRQLGIELLGKEQRRLPQLTEKEVLFFTHQEPFEWYPLLRDSNRSIKIVLPSALRPITRLIYIFKNKEKKRFLIGKTGTSLNARCSKYVTLFNKKGSEEKVKKIGRKTFLIDVKAHPEHFEVGILYALQSEEDLDLVETLFIHYKRKIYSLYNDHEGGGGGLAHAEEMPTQYAILKPEIAPFTPEKYYPYVKDEQGRIRPQLTPGFKRKLEHLKEHMEETQEFAYAIKRLGTEEYYCGRTGRPLERPDEHGCAAEYGDPENDKYDPSRVSGLVHWAMARSPEKFAIGFFPLQSLKYVPTDKQENYLVFSTIAKVEQYCIRLKQSHYSQKGLNSDWGGGGPICRSTKKPRTARRLF